MAGSRPKGVNTTVSPELCMVVGCKGKAIYRSPFGSRLNVRGYCSKHKALAMSGSYCPSNIAAAEWLANKVTKNER